MSTESLMRMVDSGRSRRWSSPSDAASFRPPFKEMGAEELGLLLKGDRVHGDQTGMIPNRSGSAPPSMEGAYAAIVNLVAQNNFDVKTSLANARSPSKNYNSEEQWRSDPAYGEYYSSNVNLNPRLPQPLIPRENRGVVRRMSGTRNWKSVAEIDSGNKSLSMSRVVLSTHAEEPEDDQFPEQVLDDSLDVSLADMHGQTENLAGVHKSLVDLIQEDFPRTPSPVYSQSQPSGHTTEEVFDHDVEAISSDFSSIKISKGAVPNSGSTCISGTSKPQEDDNNAADGSSEVISLSRGAADLDSVTKDKLGEQQLHGRNTSPSLYHDSGQENPYQRQGIGAKVISQEMNYARSRDQKVPYPHTNFSSIELGTSLHSSEFTPSMYPSPTPYVTSGSHIYPNFQQSGFYTPQYSAGGYPLNSAFFPPFLSGYASHGAVHGVSTEEHIPHISDPQHLGKFYAQQGYVLQPSFMDPLHMQHYYQHSFGDAQGASVQQGNLAPCGVNGGHIDSSFLQKWTPGIAYSNDQKFLPRANISPGSQNVRKIGTTAGSYYGGPLSMGLMTQFPSSPLPSPLLPSSPVGETRFHQVTPRTSGMYSGYHIQRGANSFQDSRRHSFLEELKSSLAGKFELSDIAGRIVEFSVDQHGSRFIQQKLEHCSVEDKFSVFKEIIPHASKLMTDVFGNYVIQKFFEHGNTEQRKDLASCLAGEMLPLSLQMYGCRVIQKALEVIELDQKIKLVHELDGHVLQCVHDQNGNHVIQKCIECIPAENIGFIISAFRGQVVTLSSHPYGCRVIQRVLEHCPDKQQCQCIVDEILESASVLAQDQYGNYVTQHVLERGNPHERSKIISKLTGRVVGMSEHKYASNVVEKCLEYGDAVERELLIDEIIGQSEDNDNLLAMMKDQFANYVVQKILEISNDKQREILLHRIRIHLNSLKKYTYGKHIVARFEQLFSEDSEVDESQGELYNSGIQQRPV